MILDGRFIIKTTASNDDTRLTRNASLFLRIKYIDSFSFVLTVNPQHNEADLVFSVSKADFCTMKKKKYDDPLLEIIPRERLSFEQKAFRLAADADRLPLQRFRREPRSLLELNLNTDYEICIWHENGTIICFGRFGVLQYNERSVLFTLTNVGLYDLHCVIYGKMDARIAETAVFFWSLKHPSLFLVVETSGTSGSIASSRIHFSVLQPI